MLRCFDKFLVARPATSDNLCIRMMQAKEMMVSTQPINALHDVHTATNDVLKGYREMSSRAQPDIKAVIARLTEMHQRHASEQEAELARFRDSSHNDSSMQGTINKAVVILRDWLSDLDRDVLPAVRKGEESLRDEYVKALTNARLADAAPVVAMLERQHGAIAKEIAHLPGD